MTLIEALSLNLPIISTDCKTGPREALCPEISVEEEIEYPYLGNYGILNQSFSNKMVFHSLKNKPLNRSEEMLAESMIKMIESPDILKRYSKGVEFARHFDKNKIIKYWMNIIK